MTTVHDVRVPGRGRRPRPVALVVALLAVLLATWAPPALAVSEEAPAGEQDELTFEELQQQSSDRAQQFFPDEYEEPSFFQWIAIPNVLIGLLVAVALVGAYLWWQPKFAAERRAKQRK